MRILHKIIATLFLLIFFYQAKAQNALCGPTTPTFTVNLTGQPNGFYMSPTVVRADTCCGSTAPDRCIQFIVTLDPAAVGLIFTVCEGAVPPGALFYQVNCGPPQAVGTGICLNPPYPDTITFCKPGSNQNQYCIQSVAPPTAVGLSQNCSALMWTFGFDESTVTWNSIAPGPIGAYNGYLNCTSGCDSTWVTPQTGYPPFIDYAVCGTVTNGCNKAFCDTVRVTFPLPLTLTVTPTNATCNGGNNGSATASVGGGVMPYSYSWTPSGGNNSTAAGLTAGNYTCTVTDSVGCKIATTFIITAPLPLTATYTANAATCSQANGDGTAIPNGGTPGYVYQWLNGQTTATATGLAPGVYPVTVGDANGCTVNISVPISNTLPIVTINSTTVTCFGGLTGTATSNASGGVPPYGYQWNNGQTTSTATGLSAGSYTVATSSSGCVNYAIVTIPQPTAVTGTITAQTNVSCAGGNNGAVTINYSGGTPGYTYQWSNGQISNSASGLTAGNYTLTVTDAQGCPSTKTVSITEPTLLSATTPTVTNVLCNGASTGSASITASGGTPGYTYQWSNGQTAPTATGLPVNNYTVITSDALGCTLTNTFVVTEPPPIVITLSADTTTCAGQNVTMSAAVQGGIPGYSYSWSPSSGTTTAIAVAPTVTTTYTLTATDANGCTQTATQIITVYPQPVAAFSAPNACLNNSIQFVDQSTGGGNIWAWNFGEPASGPNNVSSIQNPSHVYGTVGTFTVTLIMSNINGCADTNVQTLVVNPLPTVGFTSNTICFGNTTTFGNSSFITTGFITTWAWNFSDPASGANNISASQNPTHIFTTSGTFNVILTATSDSGCQSNITNQVIVNPLPTASFVPTNGCTNTPVIFADASTLATQWLWNFGNLGATSTQQNPSYTYSSQGSYVITLIVTSAGGCKDTITQPFNVYASPVPNFSPDTVCVNSPTSFTDLSVVSGGNIVGWQWDFGDGSPVDSSKSPVHIYASAGTFTVTLTVLGSNGCYRSITKNVLVFPQPSAAFTYTPEGCVDMEDVVEFTDHSFSNIASWNWHFGDSAVSFLQNPSHNYIDTGNLVVSLIVQDDNGCMDTAQSALCVQEWTFFIPNAFTPDENGKNDFFFGMGIGIIDYEMWIFDRWGNLIFHCEVNDLPQAADCRWDGREIQGGIDLNGHSGRFVQEDVYVWKVRLKNILKDKHVYVGSVTVVR